MGPDRDRPDLPRDGDQPRRRSAGARRGQQGARRRPGGLRHRLRRLLDHPDARMVAALRAPRGRRPGPARRCRRWAARSTSCPTTSAPRSTSPTSCTPRSRRLRPWPVAARGATPEPPYHRAPCSRAPRPSWPPRALVRRLALAGCSSGSSTATHSSPTTRAGDRHLRAPTRGRPPGGEEGRPAAGRRRGQRARCVTITTSVGDIGATLDADTTPCTVTRSSRSPSRATSTTPPATGSTTQGDLRPAVRRPDRHRFRRARLLLRRRALRRRDLPRRARSRWRTPARTPTARSSSSCTPTRRCRPQLHRLRAARRRAA